MPGIFELFPNLSPAKPATDYIVLVTDGTQIKEHPIIDVVGYNDGFAMRYKNGAGTLDVVYVGRRYRPMQRGGKWLIGKRLGNNSACQITVDGVTMQQAADVIGPSTDPDCPGEDLSAVVRTDGLATGYSALYESKIPWKWIIIIGVVALVVILVISFIKSRGG